MYASSRGSTGAVPAAAGVVGGAAGSDSRRAQLTPAEASYQQPDVHESGLVSAARLQMRFDIWSYPFGGVAADNVQRGQQITHQTGQVLTPTAAPDGDQIAYLSDSGGHANIWVTSSHGRPRQITFEERSRRGGRRPDLVAGRAMDCLRVVQRETPGSCSASGSSGPMAASSASSCREAWASPGPRTASELYYVETAHSAAEERSPSAGGDPVTVRAGAGAQRHRRAWTRRVYFLVERALMDGRPEFEIRAAPLGNGPTRVIKTIDASRVAVLAGPFNPALSPDGKWLAMPLIDGFTTNIWAFSTDDGRWQQVTDFGDRAIFIARRVSWSSDGRSILAAIGEGDADIVLLDGLDPGRPPGSRHAARRLPDSRD